MFSALCIEIKKGMARALKQLLLQAAVFTFVSHTDVKVFETVIAAVSS